LYLFAPTPEPGISPFSSARDGTNPSRFSGRRLQIPPSWLIRRNGLAPVPLAERAVEGYLDTEDHVGKAGSYAIQEVNDAFVEELVGDYDNIVGLPLRLVREMLGRFRAGEGDRA
jgi:hypothetical protein